ncbi:protein lethal(2)essential for life-like [Zophobas morio]|uniref:protein lethal(2)essential for life-like n=1 Tax=Zophobas morio TaxID=2755281 RepID=UPI003082C5B3
MSTILLSDPFEHVRPDQHSGLGLDPEDFFVPLIAHGLRQLMGCPAGYQRPCQKDSGSTVCRDKDKFQVNLDVQQFKPEEISVKVAKNVVTVEGKHEEKEDEHGLISRHFVRKYVLPEGHDVDKIESKLSTDGVLTITAPRVKAAVEEGRSVPVIQTGQSTKEVEKKEEEEGEEQK